MTGNFCFVVVFISKCIVLSFNTTVVLKSVLCTFSMAHIERANEAMAVETLLVTDELFRLGNLLGHVN